MKKIKSRNIVVIIVALIIAGIVAFIVFNSMKAQNNNKAQNANNDEEKLNYEKFVKEEKYLKDFTEDFDGIVVFQNKKYAIIDINQDGKLELIVTANNNAETEWFYNEVYTIKDNAVSRIDSIYSYGEVRYNSSKRELVYTSVKPTEFVTSYEFYKLENDQLKLILTVGKDGGYTDNNGEVLPVIYFTLDENNKQTNINEETEQQLRNDAKELNYQTADNQQ